MPIGNLTSQIFANIYMNEFDRFVKHTLKAKAYLRYGDDFIIIEPNCHTLREMRTMAIAFFNNSLKLQLSPKNDIILKTEQGLKFLGVVLFPYGRKLNRRNEKRVSERLTLRNAGSYLGVIKHHDGYKKSREFQWRITEKLSEEAE